ncbi:MAG: head GIN domain-containing protein [Chitinophagaceae bacterium]
MKKSFFLTLFSLFSFLALFAQKTVSHPYTEERSISSFEGLEVSAGIKVVLTQDDKAKLVVTSNEEDLIEKVVTKVNNGVLQIKREESSWKFWNKYKNWQITVYVSYNNLSKINASSGSIVEGDDVQLAHLNVKSSSGAIVRLKGKVGTASFNASSGAIVRGGELIAEKASADASSGAIIHVYTNKELDAEASSGGMIQYSGNGVIANVRTSSGGSIKRKG